MKIPHLICSLIATLALTVTPSAQDSPTLKLAAPIGNHMVLQQGKATAIWGTAEPGSQVEIAIADQTARAKADPDGNWMVKLKPLKTTSDPLTLTINSGDETLSVEDILVGEVWMCSGQSNMAWTLEKTDGAEAAIAAANHPHIRLFTTTKKTAAEPQLDCEGEWTLCTTETAPGFSGVGYYFGESLSKALGSDTPIGLINTAWGGKPSESFTSLAKLETIGSAKPLIEGWNAKLAAYDGPAAEATFAAAMEKWTAAVKKIRENAQASGKKPESYPRRPAPAIAPNLDSNFPGSISNQMIAPWTHYAIAGAIWYQGESNQWRAQQYADIFPGMIEDWRERWNDDFPFYFVQLANFKEPTTEPGVPNQWAELQEAQRLTLDKVSNTGMAIINDIGMADNIHPTNKADVGERLSRWALGKHYRHDTHPISGPLYWKHRIKGDRVIISFDHIGDGLMSRDDNELARFEIAGEDRKFVWADAKISNDGKNVMVSSKKVKNPVAVRYAWASNPEGANLVNSGNLPASLFRTDDWPLLTDGVFTKAGDMERRRLADLDTYFAALEARGWTVLFNTKDTDNWTNPYDHGEIELVNDEIRLTADKKFFLCTKETYGDFIFTGEVLLPEGQANSGFMFRCHVEPGKVYGYQAEVDGSDRRWSGGLYDEGRRGWIWPSIEGRTKEEKFLAHAEKSQAHFATPKVQNALKRNDWNKYTITCKGDKITINVNGVVTTSFKDDTDAEGHIAIQHHGEDGQVYRFRNLMLRKL